MAKRPVPLYDFAAFGQAIKAARTGRNESRKKVSDEMNISPRYLANIENKGQQPSLQIFYELVTRYDISVDQFFFPDKTAEKSTQRRQLDTLLDSMKHVATYQKTKPVYDAYRKAKSKERYRAGHERDIILHEAAAKALKAAGITKLPNPAALQKEYEALQAQKEVLYADYGKLKKKVREYDVIKQNIDSILQTGKQPERGKEAERG